MATLAEIRAQYPQYADMPDTALADALHKKFYADIPRADFDVKIGLTPAAPPQAPAPEKQSGFFDLLTSPFEMGLSLAQKPRAEQAAFIAPTVEALGMS